MIPALVRAPHRLAAHPFDVLVVGGGIYGLTVACDAAQRGLGVCLIERDDFGSGTSFNHLRTIHGGLRYLQRLDLARARESVRERRALARIAPWAVRPLPFVLPLPRSLTRGPAAMRVGFMLDRVVGADRNAGIPDTHRLPPGRVLSRDEACRAHPELASLQFTAAAEWHDYVAVEADRLTFAWALAAAAHGATLANHLECESFQAMGGRVTGARVVDRLSGERFEIRAQTVVNATGGGIDRLLTPHGAQVGLQLLQAINLVTTLAAPSVAIGARSTSGRNFFQVPWRGRALFGTWESPSTCGADDLTIDEVQVRAFIGELNQAFPASRLTRQDVTLVHRGAVPARIGRGGTPTLEGHELVFEHRASGLDGLISVAGTKYTTARSVAERIVDRLAGWVGREVGRCRTAVLPLPRVDLVGEDLLRHAARAEMAVTLADAVMRRTTLGALGAPDDVQLDRAARIVGEVHGWSDTRRQDEKAAVRRMYS